MRTAKFIIPVSVLTEFLDYINSQGLKSTIVSRIEDVCDIEIAYTKAQEHIIDDMEEFVNLLVGLVLASITALACLVEAAQKSTQ